MRYLGIDGGGSKTKFLLVDEYYNEICHIQSGPSNHLSVGTEAAREAIAQGVSHLTERSLFKARHDHPGNLIQC